MTSRPKRRDELFVKAELERYCQSLRVFQKVRRQGINMRRPDPPTSKPAYKAAVRRLLKAGR